jgi:hypothetical protein
LLKHQDGTDVKATTKIAAFLKAMRFDYVPAIKGKDYFQSLMAKLHDMLEATVEERVREASGSFTRTINENTKPILTEVLERLGLESTIELPTNLRTLFAQLEFTSVSEKKSFSLDQRGDGIKVRHIPIVLRWLAKQANHLSERGRPKTVTVWGYEEPENNLELRRCFDLAQELVEGSSEIQAFVTTHSPAFYSVFRNSEGSNVRLFLVTKNEARTTTKAHALVDGDLASLDSSMGLLDLLEPHFRAARQELGTLRSTVERLTDTTKPTIFCEGPSDKLLLEEALRVIFPAVAANVNVRCSTHHGGGHSWVSELLVAWSHSRPLAKAAGLFDKDEAAVKSAKDTTQKINHAPSGKTAFVVFLSPGDEAKECLKRHFKIPFAMEEILPADVWSFAEENGWLEDRGNLMDLYSFKDPSVTFNDYVTNTFPEPHLKRMVLLKVRLENKIALAKYVVNLASKADRERILGGLKPTLTEMLGKIEAT